MPSEIEMKKRANYHDLGRDDWMSLDEYLLSGLSDRDLGLAKGGLASLPGYAPGGPVGSEYIPGQNVSKITEHLASIRFDREAFFKGVKEAGYTKKDGSVDLKAFEKHLNKKGLSMWKMKSQRMMNNVTNELNDMLGGKFYKNVKKYSQKSILENLASKFKGFKGKYAEMYSAMTKEDFWRDALNLQEKGDKKFGTEKSKKKLKWIVDGLKKKWPSIGIGTTLTALSKLGFGKTLAMVAAHGTPIGYVADAAMAAPIIYDVAKKVKEKVIDPKIIEPAAKKMVEGENILKNLFTPKMRGGGMADIYEMTKPLGYEHGGDVSLDKIMADMEASEGPGEQGTISKTIYKLAGDPVIDPIWKAKEKIKDFGSTGFETLKELGSGVIGIAQKLLGAGPAEGVELSPAEELKLLKLQLMLEQGISGSTLMPSGNPDKIKKLEDRIIKLYIQLGE